MALPTGVAQRAGGGFHIQIKVPADVRQFWPTPFYIRKSMGTRDRDSATAQGHRIWAEATDAFAKARARLRPREFTPLTPALAAYILETVPSTILTTDEVLRFEPGALLLLLDSIETEPSRFFSSPDAGPLHIVQPEYMTPSADGSITEAQLARLKELQGATIETLGRNVSLGQLSAARGAADGICKSLGVHIDWTLPAHRPTLIAVLNTMLTAWIGTDDRSHGRPVPSPAIPEVPTDLLASPQTPKTRKAAALRLSDVVADWKAAKKRTEASIEHTERSLKLFESSGQDIALTSIKRTHGASLRAWLLHDDRPFESKTALNYWQALSALLNVAHDVGHIDANPWQGLSFEVTGSKKRKAFTDEELQKLFGTTLHNRGYWPTVQKVDHWDAYFCMLLLLWTGARVGELAQLEVVDVSVQNGLHVFSIHEEAEGSKVKTDDSVRVIPVPNELVRLGFLERVEAFRGQGKSKVFPSFHRPGKVSTAEIMSEWFRAYRTQIGAASGALNGTHRFRHTIRSALAALQIGTETADALTGHAAQGSAGRRIYTHVSPGTVKAALERLSWPLELPRVYPMPKAI